MKYLGEDIVTPFQIGARVGTIENDVPIYDNVVGTESTVITTIVESDPVVTVVHRYRLKRFPERLFNSQDIVPENDLLFLNYFDILLQQA